MSNNFTAEWEVYMSLVSSHGMPVSEPIRKLLPPRHRFIVNQWYEGCEPVCSGDEHPSNYSELSLRLCTHAFLEGASIREGSIACSFSDPPVSWPVYHIFDTSPELRLCWLQCPVKFCASRWPAVYLPGSHLCSPVYPIQRYQALLLSPCILTSHIQTLLDLRIVYRCTLHHRLRSAIEAENEW